MTEGILSMAIIPQKLYGHKKVREALRAAAERGRLHHTLLFSGPAGVGKRTTALLLAQMVMCERFTAVRDHEVDGLSLGGCNQCHHCALVRVGNMPDLITVDCSDREQCSTESVKELLARLRLRSFSGAARFFVFDNAHHLQGQAANALLKSLEEPRPGTYFVLVTDKPQLMLRTIHSRSQRWGFGRLGDDELRKIIESRPATLNSALLELANGSLALYDLFSDFADDILDLKNQLEQIARGDASLALELGSLLAQTKEGLAEKILCMTSLARHFLFTTQELRWAQFLQDIGELEYFLFRRNFAPLYILQSLFLNLAREESRTLYDENFVSQQLEQL